MDPLGMEIPSSQLTSEFWLGGRVLVLRGSQANSKTYFVPKAETSVGLGFRVWGSYRFSS